MTCPPGSILAISEHSIHASQVRSLTHDPPLFAQQADGEVPSRRHPVLIHVVRLHRRQLALLILVVGPERDGAAVGALDGEPKG